MARRRSVVRRAGAGRRVTPAAIIAVLLIIGGVALVVSRVGSSGAVEDGLRASDDVATGVGQAATQPARASENFLGRLGSMWTATEHVQQLEAQNRDLQAWRALAERLAERNARYEALLRMPPDAFGEGADIQSSVAAQLVLDSGGPFTRTLVANAGADHGVHVGFIAVNENGLIGRVVAVGKRSSRVLLLDDYNSRIPVMGEASRVRAVLAGEATQPPELLTGPFEVQAPRLDFIVGAQSLREGERMVTSGDGGLFPRGVPVGIARRNAKGDWRVELAASRSPIDFVRLIPFIGAERPEDNPTTDAGPPASTRSSVATIGHQTMTPSAAAPTPTNAVAQATPRPRTDATVTTTPAATTTTTAPAPPAAAAPANPAPPPG